VGVGVPVPQHSASLTFTFLRGLRNTSDPPLTGAFSPGLLRQGGRGGHAPVGSATAADHGDITSEMP